MTQEEFRERTDRLSEMISTATRELRLIQSQCKHPNLKTHTVSGIGSGLGGESYSCPDCKIAWDY